LNFQKFDKFRIRAAIYNSDKLSIPCLSNFRIAHDPMVRC
jgi:hypothetical protein